MFIGIDPGVRGAIAVLDENRKCVSFHDMPSINVGKGKSNRLKVSPILLKGILADIDDVECVFLEHLMAHSISGKVVNFSLGYSFGVCEALVCGLGYKLELFRPQEWKKAQGLIGKHKDASRLRALEKYPLCADSLKRKKDVDRAEALLIADYGITKMFIGKT